MKPARIAAVLLAVAIGASACGGSSDDDGGAGSGGTAAAGTWEAVVEAANDEGQATLYTGLPPNIVEEITKQFGKAYPDIKLEVTRAASGVLVQRYAAEAKAGAVVADVLQMATEPYAQEAGKAGITMKLDTNVLPEIAHVDKKFVQDSYVQSTVIPWGIAYSTDLVKTPITTYQDLLRPELRGQVLLTDPRNGGAVGGNINYLYNTYGEDFLKQLAPQIGRVEDSIGNGLQILAAGEVKAVLQSIPGADAELKAKGAPMAFVAPDKTSVYGHYLAVSAKAPHPNAGRVLANWILSAEGQQVMALAGPAVRDDVKSDIPLPAQYELVNVAEADQRKQLFGQLLSLG